MDLFDGFKRNIFALCSDDSTFRELQFLPSRERLKVFQKHSKINRASLKNQIQPSLF